MSIIYVCVSCYTHVCIIGMYIFVGGVIGATVAVAATVVVVDIVGLLLPLSSTLLSMVEGCMHRVMF